MVSARTDYKAAGARRLQTISERVMMPHLSQNFTEKTPCDSELISHKTIIGLQ
jgi:hypothetical protein